MTFAEREKELADLHKQLSEMVEKMDLPSDIKDLIVSSRELIHHLLLKHVKTDDVARCGKCQRLIFGFESGIEK